MRKVLVPVALWASVFMIGLSGCKLYRTSDSPDQSDEMERLRARVAELEASQSGKGTRPQPTPSSMSRGSREELEGQGIKVTKDEQGIRLTLSNKILFSAGSASLRLDSNKAIDGAAKVIKREFATSVLVIQGHTDNQPIVHSANKFKTNLELSVARAKAVASALQKHGLKNRLKVEGFGEARPLNENKTNEEKAQNRRVEILILNPGTTKDSSPAPALEGDTGF
jgi:flagellar motor protein MotB